MSAIKPLNETQRLRADSFGWVGQFFQSMAHMAPAAAVILAMPFIASRAGSALPLASLFGTILAMMLAYCLALLTRKYYGASGYFQIHSQALGSGVGFVTSWLFLLYEPLNAFAVTFGFSVFVLEPFAKAYLGFSVPWWAIVIIANVIITALSFTNIKSSIRTTALLGIIEFFVILVLGIMLLVKADTGFHPEYFKPSMSADGIGGLLFAFIFGFLLFVGFESGLPLSEETTDTQSSTFKGLLWSVGLSGVFYIFMAYASVVGFGGGDDTINFAKAFSSTENVYGDSLALKAFGVIGPWLIFFAAVNSTIACGLASQNATSRVFFSLGRSHVLPQWLGKVRAGSKAPVNAVLFSFMITVAATLIFVYLCRDGKIIDWYGLVAIMLTLPLLIIHLFTCISVFIAYRYKEAHDFHFLHHGIMPLLTGLLVLLPIGGAVYYNQAYPMSYAVWVTGIWFVIGLFVYTYLKRNKPAALATLESEMELLAHPDKD